jgi:hypothetical protein
MAQQAVGVTRSPLSSTTCQAEEPTVIVAEAVAPRAMARRWKPMSFLVGTGVCLGSDEFWWKREARTEELESGDFGCSQYASW